MFRLPVGLFAITFLLALPIALKAQDSNTEKTRAEIFIAPLAETLLYGWEGFAAGGGFSLGYGSGSSPGSALGIRFLYAMDSDDFIFTELQLFLRFYVFGSKETAGLFLQLNGGPVFFAFENPENSGYGALSAGLSAGWRFPFGKSFFLEPAVRTGYPYLFGGGVTGGIRL